VNIGQFFHHLIGFLDHATEQGFVHRQHRMLMLEAQTVGAAVEAACAVVTGRRHGHASN
jgi:predicted Rossmann-fold nucleotide-binding protein